MPDSKLHRGIISGNLIKSCKIIFSEYRLLKQIMSDAGTNYVSGKLKTSAKYLNIEQAVWSLYHHLCNGQVQACRKFVNQTKVHCYYWRCKGNFIAD